MTAADLKRSAPRYLRARIEAALPAASGAPAQPRWLRRDIVAGASTPFFVGGFALGTALSGAIAATLCIGVLRDDQEQRIAGEVVSAHLRSLQPGHLTDIETSDQHNVKPWFNGKLDMAPPVVDLTAQGFTLIGGRLDDINGETAAAIVYRRRHHVINLFRRTPARCRAQGDREPRRGMDLTSDTGASAASISGRSATSMPAELDEFCQKLRAALQPPPPPS